MHSVISKIGKDIVSMQLPNIISTQIIWCDSNSLWVGHTSHRALSPSLSVFTWFFICFLLIQEDLSKTDQEVIKCKHHKKHYDEKRSAHLHNIQTLEGNLKSKEKEYEVWVSEKHFLFFFFLHTMYLL